MRVTIFIFFLSFCWISFDAIADLTPSNQKTKREFIKKVTTIEKCQKYLTSLNAISETLSRTDGHSSEKIQILFLQRFESVSNCARALPTEKGQSYTISKNWFGSGYSLER